MSLDLYFYNRGSCVCEACGNEHEGEREVWRGNITHNLTQMADLALLYVPCWRPEEVVQRAEELIPLLAAGLAKLEADPEKFQALNPSNGWGCYGGLVSFVRSLLGACREWPGARVEASR